MGSILDDIDVQLESDDALKYIIMQFINENYIIYKYDEWHNMRKVPKNSVSISEKPNTDGKYKVSTNFNVSFANFKSDSLTNGLFVWKTVCGDFACSCSKITSLEGAPENVGGNFICCGCEGNFTKDDVKAVCNIGKKRIYV